MLRLKHILQVFYLFREEFIIEVLNELGTPEANELQRNLTA